MIVQQTRTTGRRVAQLRTHRAACTCRLCTAARQVSARCTVADRRIVSHSAAPNPKPRRIFADPMMQFAYPADY